VKNISKLLIIMLYVYEKVLERSKELRLRFIEIYVLIIVSSMILSIAF
jgi:hypothetical protein